MRKRCWVLLPMALGLTLLVKLSVPDTPAWQERTPPATGVSVVSATVPMKTQPPSPSPPAPSPLPPSLEPVPPPLPSPERRTIFVSVAAFRDPETADTLRSMYAKAKHPDRIVVGLVCQWNPANPDEFCVPREWNGTAAMNRLRMNNMVSWAAKGPTYARYLASLLYDKEDYFMMIDSHNQFVQNWDEIIVSYHTKCPSHRCVLSVYPMGLVEGDTEPLEGRKQVAFLCNNAQWTPSGYPGPFSGHVVPVSSENRPQPFVGAGLVFGLGRMVKDVPFDPHLPFLFHGEEILLTVRLWTAGYDFFSPGENILYHHYYRRGKPRMEGISKWSYYQRISTQRVQYILQLKHLGEMQKLLIDPANVMPEVIKEADKYGLGTVRSIASYWKFSGLDPKRKKHYDTKKLWCDRYSGPPPYDDAWRTIPH